MPSRQPEALPTNAKDCDFITHSQDLVVWIYGSPELRIVINQTD